MTDCGTVGFHANGTVSLTAPSGGVYGGMLLYVDKNCGSMRLSLQSKTNGSDSGSLDLHGTIYAPNADVDVKGNTDLALESALIANSINLVGNGSIRVTYNVLENARPPSAPTISGD